MSEWKIAEKRPDEEAGWIGKATITDLQVKKGKDIFGENSENPDDDFMCIMVDRAGKSIKVDQIRQFSNMKEVHYKSKAAQFVKAYGSGPKKGMKVNVKTNSDGFWELVL